MMKLPIIAQLIVVLACAGCRPADEITTYTEQRTTPPREPLNVAELADSLDHFLTAMVRQDDTVYFFKMSGKAPAIRRQHDAFLKFIGGMTKGDTEAKPLHWELPGGWTEKGPTEMRLETITVSDESGNLEIAVSSLPMSGEWDDFVEANVNRWLGQLGQGQLSKQKILNLTKPVETKAGSATVIELAGIQQATPSMNPHTGTEMAASKPAEPTEKPAASTEIADLSLEAPEGWQPGRVSAMRKAAYMITDGDQQAEFTLIDLPTRGGVQITDVMANVQRWAAQVGVPVDDKLAELIQKTKIDGIEGSTVRLAGPETTNPRQAMLAAMVVHGEKVWFFKLMGPAQLVERESGNFSKLLDSVKFK
jgi:hypothetical protein